MRNKNKIGMTWMLIIKIIIIIVEKERLKTEEVGEVWLKFKEWRRKKVTEIE